MTDSMEEEHTGVGVFLLPTESDPIVTASSEPAHLTTVWMGDMNDLAEDEIQAVLDEVRAYADTLEGPVVAPVAERGVLGDDDADVMFLERTDSLLALRDGLLEASPVVAELMGRVEQYPEWTPHVTLGYPDTPAAGEYDGDAVSFDRLGVWIGPEQHEFVMGGEMSESTEPLLAAAREKIASFDMAGVIADVDSDELEDLPFDELEDGEEEITEIPVHGIATLEGKATGDGRGFRPDALSFGRLPAPLGYEFEHGHGSDNSRVAVVGRIDEFWTVPAAGEPEGVFEVRWRGAILTTKEYAARAVESIVDGSYDGLSVIIDSVEVDVTDQREEMRQRILADRESAKRTGTDEIPVTLTDEEYDIEALVDTFVGDGTQEVTWFSKARIRRFDMVPTGAFQEGYVRLGHEFADEMTPEQIDASAAALADCGCADSKEEADAIIAAATFAPGTKDGPGWITHPIPTARIRRYWTKGKGAAKIAWGTPGDFNRCRAQLAKYVQKPDWLAGLCSNMHKEVLGVWPGQEGGKRSHSLAASGSAPAPIAVMASASVDRTVYPASAFEMPTEGRAFPMRIDREARTIQGYAAQWGVCHIGIAGVCQEAPRSTTDYSFFRKGVVDTDAGEQRVGLITEGIGHANEYASAAAATAHYDQTDAVRAYINVGENQHGIWYSGVISPNATDADIDKLRAIGRVSGDWRNWSGRRGDLEMVGLVAVNTEGFQLAASAAIGIGALDKEQESVTAGGGVTLELGAASANNTFTAEEIAGIAVAAAEQIFHAQKREALAEKAAPARSVIAAQALASARSTIMKNIEE